MNFFIVLFFVSLSGIVFMVGKKLRLLISGQISPDQYAPWEMPSFEEIQNDVGKMLKSLGYFLLVEIIRVYLHFVKFLKNTYKSLKTKLEERRRRRGTEPSTKTPNRFLRAMALYKRKLGKIKKEIKEEENL
ncbi:MAG: hypothetical protein M3M85_03160 [bacterium]|nr:hypothetical protein [bacterium]